MRDVHGFISRSFTTSRFRRKSQRNDVNDAADHRQILNYDLWYNVISYLSMEDVRSLAMVCKELRAATIPRLLSSVEPSDKRKLQKMCRYMCRGASCPATLLQELRIGLRALAPSQRGFAAGWTGRRFQRKSSTPSALANLLSQAVNLRVLSLHCFEDLIEVDVRVGDALAALAHLDTLELADIGPMTFGVVMRVKSRPTSFALQYLGRESSSDDLVRLMDIPLLKSVRKLTLYRFQFGNAPMNADLPGMSSLHPWPTIQELRLSYCLYLPFHRLFPDLRVLSLSRTWQTNGTDMSLVAWPPSVPLLRVTMDQHDAVIFLGAPVHCLDFNSCYMDPELLRRVVRGTSPAVLSLWCSTPALDVGRGFWRGIVSAANHPQARLRYLIIKFYGVWPNDLLRWLRDAMPLLSQTRLMCVRIIVIDYHRPDAEQREPHCDIASLPAEWKVFFNVAERSLPRAISSLRFYSMLYVPMLFRDITSYLTRNYDGEDFAWRRVVAHEGDAAPELFEVLSTQTGQMIHQYLLSEDFERKLDLNDDDLLLEMNEASD